MPLNYERIMAYRPGPLDASYDENRCILYALGIGIGMDPLDLQQIKFVNERALLAFPTLATLLGWMGRLTDPAFGIDARMVVAANLKVTLHRPLAVRDKLTSDPRIVEIIDKGAGKHAIIQSARTLHAADGAIVATVESTSVARQHGGFGGKVTVTPEPHPTPDAPPDAACDLPTPPNLALIFRLMGDENRCTSTRRARNRRLRSPDPARRRHLRHCGACGPAPGRRLRSGAARKRRGAVLAPGVSRRDHPHRDLAQRKRDLVPLPRAGARRSGADQRPGAAAMTAFLSRRVEHGIATVTFTRADKGNAYDAAMLRGLSEAIGQAEDASIRALVLRGEGRHFCAGADVGARRNGCGRGGRRHHRETCWRLDTFPSRRSRWCRAPASAAAWRSRPAAISSSPSVARSLPCRRSGSALRRARSFLSCSRRLATARRGGCWSPASVFGRGGAAHRAGACPVRHRRARCRIARHARRAPAGGAWCRGRHQGPGSPACRRAHHAGAAGRAAKRLSHRRRLGRGERRPRGVS